MINIDKDETIMNYETVDDIKLYIKNQVGLEPKSCKNNMLEYDRVTISKNTDNVVEANSKGSANMWTVDRKGHSLDYFRTEELLLQIGAGGGLLYFMFPLERSMDGI